MCKANIASEYGYEKKYVIPTDYSYLIPQILATNRLRFIKQYICKVLYF